MGLEHLDEGRGLADKDADIPKEVAAVEIASLPCPATASRRSAARPMRGDCSAPPRYSRSRCGDSRASPRTRPASLLWRPRRRLSIACAKALASAKMWSAGASSTTASASRCGGDQRGDAGGRGGASRDGLEHDACAAKADLLELFGRQEAMLMARQARSACPPSLASRADRLAGTESRRPQSCEIAWERPRAKAAKAACPILRRG